jgi:uncharacterized protein (TIGR04255 family)
MLFSEVKRVIYKKNPLDRAICQLRFPPILRIDAEPPVAFQDCVRKEFPNYSEKIELTMRTPSRAQDRIPHELLSEILRTADTKNHEFSSEDGQWKINLTRTFIALSTDKYKVWEDFKQKLQIPLTALIDIYSPSHFSRIGLRYRDVIQRSALGLDNVSWTELLQPQMLGVLDSEISESVRNLESVYQIALPERENAVRVFTQLAQDKNSNEVCYVIDSDFFKASKTPIDDVIGNLDYFNAHAFRLFRWCITERLHESMEPQEK